MKRLFALLILAMAASFVACAKDASNNTPGGQVCQVGQVISTTGACLDRGYCASLFANNLNYGWDPASNSCMPGTYVSGTGASATPRFLGQLSVINSSVYQQLVSEYYNDCNPLWISFTNYGSLVATSFMEVDAPGTSASSANITIGLGGVSPTSYPSPIAFIYFSGTVWPINSTTSTGAPNSTPGVEIQANGTLGSCNWTAVNNNGLDIKVDSQTLGSPYLSAVISYKSQQFARALLYRH